jgi:hypothetical protein
MKKIISSFLAVGFFTLAGIAGAQAGMMDGYGQYGSTAPASSQNPEISAVLQEIYKTQHIDAKTKIDCSKVTDEQLDNIGDVYMGVMFPSKEQHEAMDNMMGGEGSASLRQAHINMGRSFMGCWSDYNSGPAYMPMMGGMMGGYQNGMMNNGYAGFNMMGGLLGGNNWSILITNFLVWILIILAIAAVIKWLKKT